MVINSTLYRALTHGGVGPDAAAILADPAADNVGGAAVTTPAALTATAITAANATTPANASYNQANQTAIADLANELKVDYAALLADVTAIRTALTSLLTSLRDGGTISV